MPGLDILGGGMRREDGAGLDGWWSGMSERGGSRARWKYLYINLFIFYIYLFISLFNWRINREIDRYARIYR